MDAPKITQRAVIQTTREFTVELTREWLVKALAADGRVVPENAKFSVAVPGGGDWSNCDLEIDHDTTLTAAWIVRSVESD